jgi:hypothetical protein
MGRDWGQYTIMLENKNQGAQIAPKPIENLAYTCKDVSRSYCDLHIILSDAFFLL